MRLRVAIITVLATAALAVGVMSGCGVGAARYADSGREAYYAGQMSQALSHLKVAMRAGLGEDDPELRYIYAVTLLKHRRPAQALELFDSLLNIPEFRVRAINRSAETLISRGKLDDARARLKEALEAAPDDPTLLEALGNVQRAVHDSSLANIRKLLDQHLGVVTGKHHAWRLRAVVFSSPEDLEERFEDRYKSLDMAGFTARTKIRELIDLTRADLKKTLDLYNRVCSVNPAAFAPRIFAATSASIAEDHAAALQLYGEVAFLDMELLVEPDQRKAFGIARYEAIREYLAILRKQERYDEGITFLERMREKLPSPESVDGHLADFLYLRGDLKELGVVVSRLLDVDARSPWGCFYKGYILYSAGRFKESISYFERAQSVATASGIFNRYLALAMKEAGLYVRALQYLEQAMDRGERDAETVIARAELIDITGDPEGARRFLGVQVWMLADEPQEQEKIYEAHNAMLKRDGFTINDLRSARMALKKSPQDLLVALRLAELERQAGHYGLARGLVGRVTRRAGHLPEAHLVGARVEATAKRWRQLQDHLAQYLALKPPSAETAWLQAEAFLGLKNFDDARDSARHALSLDESFVQAARTLVHLEIVRGAYAAAEAEGNARLVVFPEDTIILQDLVHALGRQRKHEPAAKALRKLHALQPENAAIALRLGITLQWAGKMAESVPYLCKAARLARKTPVIGFKAARALVKAKAWRQAAPILERIVPKLNKGPTRTTGYMDIMEVRHHLRNHVGVLEAALTLRRSGAPGPALNTFVRLAADAGAWHEAAAAFEFALEETLVDKTSAIQGLEALLRTGSFQKARASMDDLVNRRVIRRDQTVSLRMRALIGAGQIREADKMLKEANSRSSPGQRARLWVTWLRALKERGNVKPIMEHLAWAILQAPRVPEVFLIGIWACTRSGELEQALTLGKQVIKLAPTDPKVQAVHTALLLAHGRTENAIGVAGEKTPVGAVAAAWGDQAPVPRTFGRYLYELRRGNSKGAQRAAGAIWDLPRTFQGPLRRMAARLADDKHGAALVADALGKAFVFREANILEQRADRELRSAAEQQSSAADFIDLFRAWIRVTMGSGKVAAGIIGDQIESGLGKQKPLLAYVACLVVIKNNGAKHVINYINVAVGKGGIAAHLAYDLAAACRDVGAAREAYLILRRGGETGPATLALAAEIAHDAGNVKEAADLAARLPPHVRSRMPHAFIVIRGALEKPGTMAAARDGLKRILASKKLRKQVHNLRLMEAVLEAGLSKEFEVLLHQLLAEHPYDSYVMNQIMAAAARFGRPPNLPGRIRPILTLLDPSGNLRSTPREKRRLIVY